MKQDYHDDWAQNRAKVQAVLDAGWPKYPLFFPGSEETNKSDYLFTNTLLIPSNSGWRFCGMGFGTPSGTGLNDFLTNFTMRGKDRARLFDAANGNLTSSQAGTFCDVPSGYTVQPSDKYQAVEITGGTNVPNSGWYAIATSPTVISQGNFSGGASSWTLNGGAEAYTENPGTESENPVVRTTTGAGTCSQNTSCLSGYLYTVKYTVSNVSSDGTVQVSLGGNDGTLRSDTGTHTYTEDIYCGADANAPVVFTFGGGGSETCTIDNVSVGSAAVDVENNRWSLDRSWCTGAVTDGEGFFCPELIQCKAQGTVWDGIMFKGRRLDADIDDGPDPTVLFHQLTNGQSGGLNNGKNHFTNCGFYAAKIGILCGYDLRGANFDKYYYTEPTSTGATYHGNHADHLNLDKVWFQQVETCVYLRNEQSVSHSFRDIRASGCREVFRIDSGGAIEGNGFWISGGSTELGGPTVVRLGARANHGNIVLQSVHFDHASYHPQLVVSDGMGDPMDDPPIDLHTNVVFNGGTISVNRPDGLSEEPPVPDDNWTLDPWDSKYKPNWHLVEVCSDARIAIHDFCCRSHSDDVYGLWPKCLKLNSGATATHKPHILITGTQCWVKKPEDLIDSENSDTGAIVDFDSNYRFGGATLRSGRYVTGIGWVPTENKESGETLTEASDAVAVDGSGWYTIAGEGGSDDDLATIAGGVSGDRLVISPSSDAITIIETGNIVLTGGACVLNSATDTLSLVFDGTDWKEIGRNTP